MSNQMRLPQNNLEENVYQITELLKTLSLKLLQKSV